MKKYLVYVAILFIGIFLGVVGANNYSSYQSVEVDFLNDSANLLSPLVDYYDLIEKGASQSNEEFRKAVFCQALAQRKYVAAVMRPYDDSVLNEVDTGIELLNYRDSLLSDADNLVPAGTTADDFFDKECKAFRH